MHHVARSVHRAHARRRLRRTGRCDQVVSSDEILDRFDAHRSADAIEPVRRDGNGARERITSCAGAHGRIGVITPMTHTVLRAPATAFGSPPTAGWHLPVRRPRGGPARAAARRRERRRDRRDRAFRSGALGGCSAEERASVPAPMQVLVGLERAASQIRSWRCTRATDAASERDAP